MREQFRFLIQKKGFISMRKLLSCFTLLTLTVSLFAACTTGNADVTPTPEPTATVAPTATPEPTATPTPEPPKKPTATPLPYDKSVTIMNTYGTVLEKSGVCVPRATDLENIYYVKNIKKHSKTLVLRSAYCSFYLLLIQETHSCRFSVFLCYNRLILTIHISKTT